HGIHAEPGTAAEVQGNRIVRCPFGGPYQDTYSSRDLVVRNNYYCDVVIGPFENRNAISVWRDGIALQSLTKDPSNAMIAVAATARPHGLVPGRDSVIISGDTGSNASKYNGEHPVDSATEYSFKYSVAPEILTGDAAQSKYQTIESFRPLASLTKQPSGSK